MLPVAKGLMNVCIISESTVAESLSNYDMAEVLNHKYASNQAAVNTIKKEKHSG